MSRLIKFRAWDTKESKWLFGSSEGFSMFGEMVILGEWGDLPGTIARHVDENGQQRTGQTISEWQYHLQRMVLAPDPIAYLGEHLG